MSDIPQSEISNNLPRDSSSDNQWPVPKNKDWLLARIVAMANNGICVDITLTLSGTIISGTLVPGDVYFEQMAVQVEKGLLPDQSNKKLLRQYFLSTNLGRKGQFRQKAHQMILSCRRRTLFISKMHVSSGSSTTLLREAACFGEAV